LELWLIPEPGLETRSAPERELAGEEQRHGCRLKPAEKPTTIISPTLRALFARDLSDRISLSTDPCYFFSPNSVIRTYLP
jgi:DNA-binding helix-hairpin-helix protein with protein kinase domain